MTGGFLSVLLLVGALVSGVAIAYATGAAGMVLFLTGDFREFMAVLPRKIFSQVDVFALMAMPFFIFLGELMNRSGISRIMIDFANLLVGRLRGGLGHVNVMASLFFAGVSGSAMADAAALSSSLVPSMKERGYPADYSAAITAASAIIGPIIPPSVIMLFYGAILSVDVGAMFAAAVLPGLVLALTLLAVNTVYAVRLDLPRGGVSERGRTVALRALPSMLLPVIIVSGIVFGVVTPTEAGALAVFVTLVLAGVYRVASRALFSDCMRRTVVLCGSIFALIVAGSIINFFVVLTGFPDLLSDFVTHIDLERNGYLFVVMAIYLVSGMVFDIQIALLLLAPIFAPIAYQLGVDPVHLGVVTCLNLTMGLITPPLGGVVLVTSTTTGVPYWRLFRALAPFLVIELLLLALFVFVPEISLALPRALGLIT